MKCWSVTRVSAEQFAAALRRFVFTQQASKTLTLWAVNMTRSCVWVGGGAFLRRLSFDNFSFHTGDLEFFLDFHSKRLLGLLQPCSTKCCDLLLMSLQCQGVGGILVVTMVTSFIVMYSSSISKDGSPPRSPLSSPRWNPPVSATSRAALMGYTSVMDRKVNQEHLIEENIHAFRQRKSLPEMYL